MPRYYCDYCGTYLTHDSAPGRRQHNRGDKLTPLQTPPPYLLLYDHAFRLPLIWTEAHRVPNAGIDVGLQTSICDSLLHHVSRLSMHHRICIVSCRSSSVVRRMEKLLHVRWQGTRILVHSKKYPLLSSLFIIVRELYSSACYLCIWAYLCRSIR